MGTRTIDVESVVVGETRPGPSLGPVSIELATGSIAIRDLIAMVVEEQVHDLTEKLFEKQLSLFVVGRIIKHFFHI